MNKVIYKFPFERKENFQITVPKGAEILCVKVQDNIPYLWILIDANETINEVRYFNIFGTGQEFDATKYKYISTFMIFSGTLVYHLFEAK